MDADESPQLCPGCATPMRLVRSRPSFAALPLLQRYDCKACNIGLTAEVAPGALERAVARFTEILLADLSPQAAT